MAFNLFLFFTASYFLRFSARIPALGAIRIDMLLYLILAVFALSAERNAKRGESDRITKALLVFFYCAMLSVPLAKWPGSVVRAGLPSFLKSILFFLYINRFVKTKKQLKLFMIVFISCQIFRGLEPAYLHLTEGYWGDFAASHVNGKMQILDRLAGAPYDVINPNQLAWVINNIFPFLYYLGWQAKQWYLRLGAIALAGILMYPLLLTGSRTALVCLFIIFLAIIALGENPARNLIILCFVITPLLTVIMGLLSPDMAERYRSLIDSDAAGAETSQGRIRGMKNTFGTAMNCHGIFGHGLGTSSEVNFHYLGSSLLAHILYVEAMQEVGFVGLFFIVRYMFILLSILKKTKADLEYISSTSYLFRMITALQVWIFYQLVYDFACFGLSGWEWYLFGGVTLVTTRIAIEENQRGERDKIDLLNIKEAA